jgi:hypothetical protein
MFQEDYIASIVRVEEQAKQEASRNSCAQLAASFCWFLACFTLPF